MESLVNEIRSEATHVKSSTIFECVHMDICGPYLTSDYVTSLYVVTLVDSASSYALVRATRNCPTSGDTSALFRRVLECFNTLPATCHTDNGSQFVSGEFVAVLLANATVQKRSPVRASFCNGKVERLHRVLNQRIRAHVSKGQEQL